ncbi:MAG: hypothetical protein J5523_01445 [Muribaculaceae bacterium]|nr:hypothetical protein [Muribaculaceae bacterium]
MARTHLPSMWKASVKTDEYEQAWSPHSLTFHYLESDGQDSPAVDVEAPA